MDSLQDPNPSWPVNWSSPIRKGATAEQQSNLLLEDCRQVYSGLINFGLVNGTVLIAIHGWFISSKDAQDFVRKFQYANWLVSIALVAYSVFHCVCLYLFLRRSENVCQRLRKLNYFDSDYVDLLRISRLTVNNVSAYHLASVCIVIGYIYLICLSK